MNGRVIELTINQPSWQFVLQNDIKNDYFVEMMALVGQERMKSTVFPPEDKVFRAFDTTSYDDVKVVILGQDPYHEQGQAEGLSFSVPNGTKLPPSLVNIIKEIDNEYGLPVVEDGKVKKGTNGSLVSWAEQGVLLLNTVLTVREGEAFSHKKIGWERFTDAVIRAVNNKSEPVVFFLWGNPAAAKEVLITNEKHLVLKCAHPSPLSARRGFFGCNHFKQANEFLKANGYAPISWTTPWKV